MKYVHNLAALWLVLLILSPSNGSGDLLTHILQGPLLLTWFNFNPSMDK